jgi:hypothetical protein
MDSWQGAALKLGSCVGLTPPHNKKVVLVMNYLEQPRKWTDSLAQPKHRKMDMRFGTWKCQEPLQDRFIANGIKGVRKV